MKVMRVGHQGLPCRPTPPYTLPKPQLLTADPDG